jgi:hypothetical protein
MTMNAILKLDHNSLQDTFTLLGFHDKCNFLRAYPELQLLADEVNELKLPDDAIEEELLLFKNLTKLDCENCQYITDA